MKLKDIDTETLIRSVSLESGRKSKQKGKSGTISPKTVRNEFGLITAVLNYYGVTYNESQITLPQVPVLLAMWLSFSASEIAGLTKSGFLLQDVKYIALNEVVLTIDGYFQNIIQHEIQHGNQKPQ